MIFSCYDRYFEDALLPSRLCGLLKEAEESWRNIPVMTRSFLLALIHLSICEKTEVFSLRFFDLLSLTPSLPRSLNHSRKCSNITVILKERPPQLEPLKTSCSGPAELDLSSAVKSITPLQNGSRFFL